MVGTSKILTVSYGTFSCTLEGFDDSFNTMKAIAEYFRGLAAEDRYFGAEPPAPDAELLAKIAEREISRRVDAHVADDGIVLRAASISDQTADSAETQHDKNTRAEVEAARKAAKAERKAAKAAARAEAKAEKQAAKAKAKAEKDAVKEAAEESRDEDVAVSGDDLTESESSASAEPTEGTTGPEVEETRDSAPSSTLAAEDPAPEIADEAPAAQKDVAPDSVAAKLKRIRAVVSEAGADNATGDSAEQFLPQAEAPDVADTQTETDDAAAEDNAIDLMADFEAHEAELEETVEADQDQSEGSDMISRVMARRNEAKAAADAVETAEPNARVVRMKRADFDEKSAGDLSKNAQNDAAPTSADFGALDGADEFDDYLEDSDFNGADISIDLDDDMDADLAQNLEAIQGASSDDVAEDGLADDIVSDESAIVSEEDVSQDAVSEAEDADVASEDTVADKSVAKDEGKDDAKSNTPAYLLDNPKVDEDDLDRLMDQTDAHMQEPEGNRRRNAIAQLKAAVAAKQAARKVGEPEDDGQDVENAFRNDLSEAVRPEGVTPPARPAVRTETRTERPRSSPLKLVNAQRIDPASEPERHDAPEASSPAAATAKDDSQRRAPGSFAEFADNMGAKELPDLLEAAAAYTSFVEGADEFSRPQILRRVRAVAADDFKREDELRTFADLISTGRFTKVRNGRFQVADDSRYNPERRAS